MQGRGRSREVSHTAVARQAWEESRSRTSRHYLSSPSLSRSPSPLSPGDDANKPHRVYSTLDDIQQAKLILLRLRGISNTVPDDPRIATARPEDFDDFEGLVLDKEVWWEDERRIPRQEETSGRPRRLYQESATKGSQSRSESSAVSMQAVLAAMSGPLFSDTPAAELSALFGSEPDSSHPTSSHRPHRRRCRTTLALRAIPIEESPLHPIPTEGLEERPLEPMLPQRQVSFVEQIQQFVRLAQNVHSAYTGTSVRRRVQLAPLRRRPLGYVACYYDIIEFISESANQSDIDPDPVLIPLICPNNLPSSFLQPSPSRRQLALMSTIPSPPKYSAARYRTRTPSPPAAPVPRLRCVPNPVYLRLKAAQNVMAELGVERPPQKPGKLAGGEKLVGLGYDVGKSCLRRPIDEQPAHHRPSMSRPSVLTIP